MTVRTKVIGRLPQNKREWDPNYVNPSTGQQGYGLKFRVFQYGCELESKIENNTYEPFSWDGDQTFVLDVAHWELCSGNPKVWAAGNPKPATTGATGDYPYNGMGRVVIPKNMVDIAEEGNPANIVNLLTQDAFEDGDGNPLTNTVFIIQYDFVLEGETIVIPSGCVLEFEGGSFANGTIQGNHTVIIAPDERIFITSPFRYKGYDLSGEVGVAKKPTNTYLYISGTWDNEYVSTAWNGLDSISSQEDASQLIIDYITLHKQDVGISLPSRVYGIYGMVEINNRNFDANNSTFIFCDLAHIYGDDVDIPEGAEALSRTYFKRGLPLVYNSIYIRGAGVLSNFTIDQSNVTNDDIDLNGHWGIYGLVGKWGSEKSYIKNIHIKNAFECGFIGISGETVFEDCSFDGSGEHEVYGRPTANVIFRRCKFTNWENNQTIATARGAAFAIKVCEASRNANYSVIIEDCEFVKGNGLSTCTLEIEADNVYIYSCKTDHEPSLFDCTEGRTLNVYINNCVGIFNALNTKGIFHINNSRGTAGCLYNAYEIKDCILSPHEMSWVDSREVCQASMIDTIRTMTVDNCIFLFDDAVYDKIRIAGVYNLVFRNVKFLYNGAPDGIGKIEVEIRPKADNTTPSGVSPKFLLDSCYANLGKRDGYFCQAEKYDVTLKNCIFCGERNYVSGYLGRLYVLNAVASLSILNSFCIPGKDNTVLSLYPDSISITRINPTYFGGNPASNIGLQSFDYTNGKPIWYNGTVWVYADGSPVT